MSANFLNCDFFTLLGLPAAFDINEEALRQRYQALQKEVHPDRFANKSESERTIALGITARINEAYDTIQKPLSRAAYLLSLRGVEVFSETNTTMPADFLMQQMEWREALADSQTQQKPLSPLRDEVQAALFAVIEKTKIALTAADNENATDAVRRWKYLQKLLADIDGMAV